jgi:hypothetical protein
MHWEFLLAVWGHPGCRAALMTFINAFVNGDLPISLKPVLLATKLIPTIKQDGTGRCRFIEAGETLRRWAASCAVTFEKTVIRRTSMPLQSALAVPSGMQAVVLEAQGLIRNFEKWGIVDIDLSDAFPSTDLTQALNTFFRTSEYKKLWNIVDWMYRDPFPTFVLDKSGSVVDKLVHANGLGQGCALSMVLFCTNIQALLASAKNSDSRTRVIAYADNIKFQGPLPALQTSFDTFLKQAPDFKCKTCS